MKDHNSTIKHRIKEQLEKGFILTVLGVFKELKTYELRTYIASLKKSGMKIKSEWNYKGGKRFKSYYLAK